MCAIVGIVNGNDTLLDSMLLATKHRGPDGSGIFNIDNLVLGHNRLAIIDLDRQADQPFRHVAPDGNLYVIVFNGEIYNYIEIKEELKKYGFIFKTNSDTEVLVAAYCHWGTDCLLRFNGMWSFAIYNQQKKELFISRDRFGVKPLYYAILNDSFVFSSELKSLISYFNNSHISINIDIDALNLYFSLGYIPSPFSIFNEVKKLEAAHNLIYNVSNGQYKIYKYYNTFSEIKNIKKATAFEEFNYLLNDSVKLRLRSDVEVGAFLSGGIDSSSIVKYMADNCDVEHMHTYSIGFEGELDETAYINISKNSIKVKNHHHRYFYDKDFNHYHSAYFESFDEPFADYSGFSSLMVSELGKLNSTVILSGDGGDEVFGGYNIYNIGYYIQIISILPKYLIRILISQFKKLPNSTINEKIIAALELAKHPKHEFISAYLQSERFNPPILKNWSEPKLMECLVESNNYLPTALTKFDQIYNTLPDKYLTKVDRSSMRYGVEVRSPYLDFRIVEFGNSLPDNHKVFLWRNKIFLKEALKNKLPKEILHRSKHGFTPPFLNWISQTIDTDKYNLDLLDIYSPDIASFYRKRVLLNTDKRFNKEYLIRLYIFNKWFKKWIVK